MTLPAVSRGPIIAGAVLGLTLGLSPLTQADVLSTKALWTLGLGLGLTYFSIGILVVLIPRFGPFAGAGEKRWVGFLWGVLIGGAYSLPGAFFTMVPYPLAADAAAYWREFADGGLRAWALTIGFGGLIGGLCGIFLKQNRESHSGS